jgi:hypothetical protein
MSNGSLVVNLGDGVVTGIVNRLVKVTFSFLETPDMFEFTH